MPRAGTAAQQHRIAAALHELPREGDERLPGVPGGEEGGPGGVGRGIKCVVRNLELNKASARRARTFMGAATLKQIN
jgi:hypothetical protein